MVKIEVEVPRLIYDIYADTARLLPGYSVEQVMSAALHAYAERIVQQMLANGELPE